MVTFKKHLILCLLATAAVQTAATAQTARIYDASNGLPNTQITSISQDSGGFIWICSHSGIARFDGISFTSFIHDSNDPNSIASDLVLAMFEDSNGTRWVGTSQGLQIYNENTNDFTLFHLYSPEPHITCMAEYQNPETGKKRLFFATSGRGIIVMDPETHGHDTALMEQVSQAQYSLFTNFVSVDSKGRLWLSSETGGFSVVSANTCKSLDNITWDRSLKERQKDIIVLSAAEDPESGNIFFCTEDDGILVFDAKTQKIRKALGKTSQRTRASSVIYNDILETGDGKSFILGIENGGVGLLDIAGEETSDLNLPNTPYEYNIWKIHNLLKDSQGNLWLSAFQKGILTVPKQIFGFSTIQLSTRQIHGDNSGCVTSIVKDESTGTLWIGCDGGGLFSNNPDKGGKQIFNAANSGLGNDSVTSIVLDKRGTLWIGTYLGGIFYKTHGGPIREFRGNAQLHIKKISSLVYDSQRDLIFAGTLGGGLVSISAADQRIRGCKSEKAVLWISSLTLDEKDRIWIGGNDGLIKYDIALDEIETVEQREDYQKGAVLCTCADGDTLWIGTRKGLVSYNTVNGHTHLYSKKDGLAGNSICAVEKDNGGNLWIATTTGMSCMDIGSGEIANYYDYDGLQGNEFKQAASSKDSRGIMYFGGNNGLTRVNPDAFNTKLEIPAVHFTNLLTRTGPVDYNPELGKRNIIDNDLDHATRITLPHRNNFFAIMFSVLEFTNPDKMHYKYRLDRFDRDWIETGHERRGAMYTRLNPGRYVFKVRAFYEDKPDFYSEKDITVKVKAPWYYSWWASLIYMTIIAGIVMAYRIMKRNRDRNNLQTMRLDMFTNLTHEIRTPLNLVMGPLKNLREEESSAKLKDTYNLMYRNCLRINRIVNQVMDTRKIDEGKMKLNFRETDIVYFIKDIMQSFKALVEQQNVRMSIDSVNVRENLWIDQGNFDKIIFNILSNAFKNTPEGGNIHLHVSSPQKNNGEVINSAEEFVRIDIFNSGSHLNGKDIKKIFERFYQGSSKDLSAGSGVGLNLTKMLVELHHGSIDVENTVDGVNFIICIPCDKKHLTKEELDLTTHHKDLYTKEMSEILESSGREEDSVKLAKTRKTVIFVDDDDDMLSFLQKQFRQTFNVITFSKAYEAWPVIKAMKPDAVVTDLVMEGMSGTELCSSIKSDNDTALTPVIILTAQTEEEYLQDATDKGADRILTKPISTELLSSSILQTITSREKITARQDNSIIYEYGSIKMNSASDKLVAKVMETIKKNIDNSEFSVEMLCQEVGISRVHLNRKLKELLGTSPSVLIRSIRLRQAAFLLINNQVGIAEVAFKVGYSSLSHFSNSFHEYFSMSPKEFIARYHGVTDEEELKKIFE